MPSKNNIKKGCGSQKLPHPFLLATTIIVIIARISEYATIITTENQDNNNQYPDPRIIVIASATK